MLRTKQYSDYGPYKFKVIENFAQIFKVKPDITGFRQILVFMDNYKAFSDVFLEKRNLIILESKSNSWCRQKL